MDVFAGANSMTDYILRCNMKFLCAVRNAFGYCGRGAASRLHVNRALFERYQFDVAVEDREATMPTGEAAAAARVGEAVRVGVENSYFIHHVSMLKP